MYILFGEVNILGEIQKNDLDIHVALDDFLDIHFCLVASSKHNLNSMFAFGNLLEINLCLERLNFSKKKRKHDLDIRFALFDFRGVHFCQEKSTSPEK